jgi:hypothetical protein
MSQQTATDRRPTHPANVRADEQWTSEAIQVLGPLRDQGFNGELVITLSLSNGIVREFAVGGQLRRRVFVPNKG